MSLADQVDWVAKHRLLDGYRERHGLDWGDARLAALDLQYHDLRPEKSLAARVGLERITDDAEVERAMTEPPADTRAYFRGRCLPEVRRRHRRRQLGLPGVRHRRRAPAAGPDDGTAARNRRPCG